MKEPKKSEREEYLYHNTELLLKKYRDVVWSIEVSALQAKMSFELETNTEIDKFLEVSYIAGVDFSNAKIHEQIRSTERNQKMLQLIDAAVDILKRKHVMGDEYYWILYFTYLSEKPSKNIADIIKLVNTKTEPISWKTYFKRRKEATEVLGSILWGFTSKECLDVLKEFAV